jgi:predicted dehydrogenase
VSSGRVAFSLGHTCLPILKSLKPTSSPLCDISRESLQRAMKRLGELYERRAKRAEEEGDKERAEQLRRDVQQIRLYTDYGEMLRKEKPDLVEICTSP